MFNYIKNKINDSKLIMEPFPHLIIDNLIPKEIFEDLKKEVNTLQNFEPFTIHEGRFSIPSNEWKDNLEILKKELYNEEIRKILIEKFKEQLLKLKEYDSKSKWQLHLSIDKSNYEIPPHLDSPSKQLSVLYYISGGNVGTSLYTNNHNGKEELDYKKAKKVKEIEFKENRLIVFCSSIFDHTWHGVEKSNIEQKRIVIQGFLELFDKPKTTWSSFGIGSIRHLYKKRDDNF
jgi:hypothetical protein